MLNFSNTGSIAEMISSVRDVPARRVPYATSTALTRTARRAAKDDLPAEMVRVFDRPTRYTLNSLFVVPSKVSTLSARVMVKDRTSTGVVPEKFLQPEVEGGPRGEKGIEKALRYAGILRTGERVVPARDMRLDAYGNVPGARIRSILNSLAKSAPARAAGARNAVDGRFLSGGTGKGVKASGIFAGKVGKARGIWERSGTSKAKKVKPLFIFISKAPKYKQRLDFSAVSERAARKYFADEFSTALNATKR